MTALSKTGQRRLAHAEEVIERGFGTFVEVGDALLSIRDERLYRDTHDTFELYCRHRWGLSKSRAYQLMDAAEVSTIVDVANEAQARALAPVKDDPIEVREVYAEAEKRGDTTAAGLSRVVNERKPKVAEEDKAAQPPAEVGAVSASAGRDADTSSALDDVAHGQHDLPMADRGDGGSPSAPVPPVVGGAEGYRAASTKARSTVRSSLLTLDPERVITTADEPDHWRQFSTDVRGWLDELDEHLSGPALKAVQ